MKQISNQQADIIFVTIAMKGGGTERVIAVLSNYFAEQKLDVMIMMIAGNKVEYSLNPAIRLTSVADPTGGNNIERLKRIIKIRRTIKQNKNATVYAMGTVASLFTLFAAIGLKNKIVVSERNDPNRVNHRPITSMIKNIRNLLYRRAYKVIFQTEDAKECFPKYIKNKSFIIPNPVSAELPEICSGKREKTVVTVGRLTSQKNHKMLINVFALFLKEYNEYTLKIYGTGELEKELSEQISSLGLQNEIELCGFKEDIYNEINNAGIYVSSSNWEGISNSLVEALALGIPTIATDCPVGGTRMCMKDGINGFIIPTDDEKALLEKMCLLASDEKLASEISKRAITIRQEYSESKIADMWRNL